MNKIIQALHNGKVVYNESPEPRFYKITSDTIYYSDDLIEWKKSSATLEIFNNESNWIIK